MDPLRRTALIAGIFYLLTFAASIPAIPLVGPVLHDPTYVIGPGVDTRVILGCLLDLINAAACVGTAVALFPVVKRQSEGLALGFVTSRMFEAAVIVVGVISLLAVVTMRQEFAATAGADPATTIATARALVIVRDWTFLIGPGLVPGVNALLLGTLLYRSGLVPRVIPAMGLVGGPLLLAVNLATIFGVNEQTSVASAAALAPLFFWELSVGMYMAFKGFRPSTITTTTIPPAPAAANAHAA
jgi:hypothetical protein